MKYCTHCQKTFDSDEDLCPVCGTLFIEMPQDECDESEDAEIITTMMITGIL